MDDDCVIISDSDNEDSNKKQVDVPENLPKQTDDGTSEPMQVEPEASNGHPKINENNGSGPSADGTVLSKLERRRLKKVVKKRKRLEEMRNPDYKKIQAEKELKELKKERRLNQLENAYKVVRDKIHELEVQEVVWEDDYNSSFMKVGSCITRLVKIYNKMKKYLDEPVAKKQKISFSESDYVELNRKVEEYMNRPGVEFPDFCDIHTLIENINKELSLDLSEADINKIALAAFLAIGRQLQYRRFGELRSNIFSLLHRNATDPARDSEVLAAKLNANQETYKNREAELLAEYTRMAEEQNLEPEEVNDVNEESEADEDESESEEEEPDDDDIIDIPYISESEDENTSVKPEVNPVKAEANPVKVEVKHEEGNASTSVPEINNEPLEVKPEMKPEPLEIKPEIQPLSSQDVSVSKEVLKSSQEIDSSNSSF